MIKPNRAVDRKGFAWCWWVFVLLVFVGYVAWTVISAVNQRDDPPTVVKFTKEESLSFPAFWICHNDNELESVEEVTCDTWIGGNEGTCGVTNVTISFLGETDDGKQCALFNADREHLMTSSDDLFEVSITFEDTREGANENRTTNFVMISFYEDADRVEDQDLFYAPTNGLVSMMSLQMTKRTFLDDPDEFAFVASSSVSSDSSVGKFTVQLSIRFASMFVRKIQEVDPVQPAQLIGAIGGAWGYVALLFGLFFATNPRNGDVTFRTNKGGWGTVLKSIFHSAHGDGDVEMAKVKKNKLNKADAKKLEEKKKAKAAKKAKKKGKKGKGKKGKKGEEEDEEDEPLNKEEDEEESESEGDDDDDDDDDDDEGFGFGGGMPSVGGLMSGAKERAKAEAQARAEEARAQAEEAAENAAQEAQAAAEAKAEEAQAAAQAKAQEAAEAKAQAAAAPGQALQAKADAKAAGMQAKADARAQAAAAPGRALQDAKAAGMQAKADAKADAKAGLKGL